MRKWLEKWGSTLGAFLCVLIILFAAVYTRQDDLRRLAAENAASDQSETLRDVQPSPAVYRPVSSKLLSPFSGAVQSESGFWQFDPYIRYEAASYQEILSILNGVCLHADEECILISHPDALISCYRGEFSPEIKANDPVTAGQRIARMKKGGILCFSLQKDSHYIDPEAFFEK